MPIINVAEAPLPYSLRPYFQDPITAQLITPIFRLDTSNGLVLPVSNQSLTNLDGKGPAVLSATFNRPNNATAYASGQLIGVSTGSGAGNALLFAAARVADAAVMFRRIRMQANAVGWAGASVRVHIFRTAVAPAVGDGGAIAASLTAASDRCAIFDLVLSDVLADGAQGVAAPAVGTEVDLLPVTGTVNFWAVLEARSAITTVANTPIMIAAEIWRG